MRKGRVLSAVMAATMLISTLSTSSVYMAAPENNTSIESIITEKISTEADVVAEFRENLNYREVDLDLDLSFSDEVDSIFSRNWGTLPKSYSSSVYVDWDFEKVNNYVTPVKNQDPYGTCWAYSTIAAAEASYIINNGITDVESIDFNEYHLVHYTYDVPNDPLGLFGGDYNRLYTGDSFLDSGGNNGISANVLANWIGVSDSVRFKADDVGAYYSDDLAFDDVAHLENAYYIYMPDMTTGNYLADMNMVKNALMNYGALATSYGSYIEGGDELTGYYYCPYVASTNHAVTIIGWDDTIPASAFTESTGNTPAGDGAWLIKNSWGDSGDFDGYFWLSYYDATLDGIAFSYDMVDADNYDNNYQYDGTGLFGDSYSNYETISSANAFVADSEERLEAVGFYTYDTNVDYEIRIYTGLEDNEAPQYGELVLTQTGSQIYAGYHTVELNSSVLLAKGERYAIVVTLSKAGYDCSAAVDESASYGWIKFYSYAKAGESYLGTSVDTLFDCNEANTEYADGVNVKIKAFTDETGNETIAYGDCGDNLTWTLNRVDGHNVLTISGKGEMWNLDPWDASAKDCPWEDYKELIEKIVVQEGVSAIGEYAFDSCINVKDVVLSNSIIEIKDSAFWNCEKLQNIELPVNLKSMGALCFEYCDSLENLIIPDSVTFIGNRLAQNCDDLEYVYIGSSADVENIVWASLFSGCPSLEKIEVSRDNSVMKSVEGVLYSKDGKYLLQYPMGQKADSYKILSSAEMINAEAFQESVYLKKVIIPEGMKTIGDGAFGKCEALESLTIPASVTELSTHALWEAYNVKYVYNKSNVEFVLPTMNMSWWDINGNSITSITNGIAISNYADLVAETGVSLNTTSAALGSGEALQLTANIMPTNATFTEVTYSSSDETLATVDQSGLVKVNTTGKAGTVVITAATIYEQKTASCTIEVKPVFASKITLNKTSVSLVEGEKATLTATIVPANATNKAVTWSSSNTSIATVDANGKVTAVGVGTATITATVKDGSGVKASCTITVKEGYPDGLNKYTDGKLYYFKDNKIDTTYNGVADYEGETWYVKNGKVDITVNGLQNWGGKWYLFSNGKVNRTNTVAQNSADWWYVSNGEVDFNYDGVGTNSGGTWYIENGQVDFSKNGLYQRGDTWYYFKGGAVDYGFTGLTNSSVGWWYIENGIITFEYTGLTQYGGSWWYVENSNLNFKYDGVAANSGGTWYIEDSKVDFGKNGLYQRGDWYYFKGGKVDTGFTGLTNSSVGWWYIENGVITFKYTGLTQYGGSWWYVQNSNLNFKYDGVAANSGGTWYIEDSKVDFSKNGLYQRGDWYYFKGGKVDTGFTGLTNSSEGWWYIENGKITFKYTNLVQYGGSWWYVENSNLNFKYDGVADYNNATWYIEDSKVDFSKNGLQQRNGTWYLFKGGAVNRIDSVEYYGGSWWYVDDGVIDFNYNGLGTNVNGTWYIKNGKVDFGYNGTYEFEGETYNVVNGKATLAG